MKNKHILFLCTFLCCTSFIGTACSDDKERVNSVFEIKDTYLSQNVSQEQTILTIPVTTNLETSEWAVSSEADWCVAAQSYDSGDSSIKLAIKANYEVNPRSTSVKVKSSLAGYTIQVAQLGYGPAILIKGTPSRIGSEGGEVEITVTTNIEYDYEIENSAGWITEKPHSRALEEYNHRFTVSASPDYEERSAAITFLSKSDRELKATYNVLQDAKESSISDVEIEGDTPVKPTGGQASEAQSGWGIEYSYDGIIGGEKHYHSVWNQEAQFPVVLEYYFEGNETIDYFIYHTRSGNGNFGEVKVYSATAESPDQYLLQGTFDFKKQNASSTKMLSEPVKAVKIKFEVYSGAGDYVSCDEMQFFRKGTNNRLHEQLLTVFTDLTCSAVKDGVSSQQINALPGYFARIATVLKNDTYDAYEKPFRIRDYEPYSDVEVWAEKLMTKRYGNLDNPTGIHANKGDSLVVLVGETNGQKVALQSIPTIEPSGDYYLLEEGVNKIGIQNTGMLFLMHTADLETPGLQPVKVHIPLGSGTVDGFFDLKEHKTDQKYAEILSKASYKYFCVRGEKIIFYFHRSKMLEHVPDKILSAINLWDNMIGWQQELMGIEDVRPQQVNNHVFAVSPEDSYMWASDYRIGFVYTYLGNILLYDNVMAAKDNAWGPAHEIGHIHQKAINWPGSTESSNNLFSNYTLYKLGKYCSRGSELSELATVRCIDNKPWADFGSGHQNENTELHMRMNWQLWNYYHRCGYKKDFFQTLFKLLREERIVESDPGTAQLHFAKMASKAANQDLTEFFEMWGFFVPVDIQIEQYGSWKYKVTETMIKDAQNYLSAFPKAKHAFYYLEDRKHGDVGIESYQVGDVGHYTQFEKDQKITKTPSYTLSGRRISISDGEEAVAFELYRGDKRLFFFNFLSFDIPESVTVDNVKVYAVQANGERILLSSR